MGEESYMSYMLLDEEGEWYVCEKGRAHNSLAGKTFSWPNEGFMNGK